MFFLLSYHFLLFTFSLYDIPKILFQLYMKPFCNFYIVDLISLPFISRKCIPTQNRFLTGRDNAVAKCKTLITKWLVLRLAMKRREINGWPSWSQHSARVGRNKWFSGHIDQKMDRLWQCGRQSNDEKPRFPAKSC